MNEINVKRQFLQRGNNWEVKMIRYISIVSHSPAQVQAWPGWPQRHTIAPSPSPNCLIISDWIPDSVKTGTIIKKLIKNHIFIPLSSHSCHNSNIEWVFMMSLRVWLRTNICTQLNSTDTFQLWLFWGYKELDIRAPPTALPICNKVTRSKTCSLRVKIGDNEI